MKWVWESVLETVLKVQKLILTPSLAALLENLSLCAPYAFISFPIICKSSTPQSLSFVVYELCMTEVPKFLYVYALDQKLRNADFEYYSEI